MAQEFSESSPHMVFPNVRVLSHFQTKKGGSACKFGWLTEAGAGDRIIYGEDADKLPPAGEVCSIRANVDGDFLKGVEVVSGATAPRRRSSAA